MTTRLLSCSSCSQPHHPCGVSRDEFPVMLQELLREFPVYAMTIARDGRKLTQSALAMGTPTEN